MHLSLALNSHLHTGLMLCILLPICIDDYPPLPKGVTPYEKSKPEYTHLRVWASQAFILDPAEIRLKGGPMRYEGIFICYEENRKGWGCVDLNRKYRFTNDMIFNESAKGNLGRKRWALPVAAPQLPPSASDSTEIPPRRSERLQHQSQLREQMKLKRDKLLQLQVPIVDEVVPELPSVDFLTDYATLVIAESLVHDSPYSTLEDLEECSILRVPPMVTFSALSYSDGLSHLHRPPPLYCITQTRTDWLKWEEAMQWEVNSLEEKGFFEWVPVLPEGRCAIPLMWVYDFKHGLQGEIVMEKVCVVILGNRQGVLDMGETYSAVTKSTSI